MEQQEIYHLFVYGSLRSGFPSSAYEYVSRYFDMIGPGRVKGRLYDMGDYPAAIPTTEDFFIVGELYRIRDEAEFYWAMAQLDDYEGVTVEPGEKPLYRRELADVYLKQRVVTAWIYWYNDEIVDRPPVSSGDILEYLKNK